MQSRKGSRSCRRGRHSGKSTEPVWAWTSMRLCEQAWACVSVNECEPVWVWTSVSPCEHEWTWACMSVSLHKGEAAWVWTSVSLRERAQGGASSRWEHRMDVEKGQQVCRGHWLSKIQETKRLWELIPSLQIIYSGSLNDFLLCFQFLH